MLFGHPIPKLGGCVGWETYYTPYEFNDLPGNIQDNVSMDWRYDRARYHLIYGSTSTHDLDYQKYCYRSIPYERHSSTSNAR